MIIIGMESNQDIQLSTIGTSEYNLNSISAILLSNNKVFIVYSYGTNKYLNGVICTIEGDNITAGTDTQLSNKSNAGRNIKVVSLSESKVFIAHAYADTSTTTLYAMVCTIEGDNITVGTDTQLSNNSKSGSEISIVTVSESKVFIAHSYNSTKNLYGIVCTINNTAITTGTDTQLSSFESSGSEMSAILLADNKIFIAFGYKFTSSSYYLNGIVCTINNITITTGKITQLDSLVYQYSYPSAILLNEDKVLVTYTKGVEGSSYTKYYLYGIVCNINNTTITKGTDTQLKDTICSTSLILLSNNKVFIIYDNNTSNKYLYGMICTIEGKEITKKTDIQLSTIKNTAYSKSAILLLDNKVFIAHSYGENYYLYGMICNMEEGNVTQIKSSSDKILGIAKTKGTEGETVQVYVPKLAEYICTEDENRIITENGEEIRNE